MLKEEFNIFEMNHLNKNSEINRDIDSLIYDNEVRKSGTNKKKALQLSESKS